MTINLSMPVTHELRPRITVVGVGGAGTNAVNNMITSHLEGVEFVACNTDAQSLHQCLTERRIQLGNTITQGLGAGARPEIGRASAEEAIEELLDQLNGSHMVFITAGMGGGTGTGAAPVIARAVREQGILTVGVVTKPFHFEGTHRMRVAERRACRTAAICRHAVGDPEPESVPARQRTHHLRRCVQARRQRAAYGRARGHRPDGHARPDQPRLRRHPHSDERDGQGDDGHGRGRGRTARGRSGRGGDLQPAARRGVDEGCARRAHQHHRRRRHDPVRGRRGREPGAARRSIPRPTSSSARRSTNRWTARCASPWWPPASMPATSSAYGQGQAAAEPQQQAAPTFRLRPQGQQASGGQDGQRTPPQGVKPMTPSSPDGGFSPDQPAGMSSQGSGPAGMTPGLRPQAHQGGEVLSSAEEAASQLQQAARGPAARGGLGADAHAGKGSFPRAQPVRAGHPELRAAASGACRAGARTGHGRR